MHVRKRVVAAQFQERRSQVQQADLFHRTLKRAARRRQDERAVLGVVAIIGPGVVLLDVERSIADLADGTPVEIAEIDNQVGGYVADLAVNLLGLEDARSHRLALVVHCGFEPRLQVIADALVVVGVDRPARLAPLHVQEHSRVVPAFAPGDGAFPIHVQIGHLRGRVRVLVEREQTLLNEPLVDAEAAVQPLGAVVGEDQHGRLVVQQFQQRPDLGIEASVVVADHLAVGIAGHVVAMLGVLEFPEAVVHPV
jgi:hypothetical protein